YRSRRDSAKNPLLLRKAARCVARVVVRNRDESIDNFSIEDFGDETGADPLDLVGTRFSAGEHGRVGRLDGKNFQRLDFLLKDLAGAGGGTAGSDSDHERIEFVAAD